VAREVRKKPRTKKLVAIAYTALYMAMHHVFSFVTCKYRIFKKNATVLL
jgi:hypothetical protein